MQTAQLPKLSMQIPYTKTVQKLHDTGKDFKTQLGTEKRKYKVFFTDGYQAEYCLGKGINPGFKDGDTISFKVTFQKEGFQDEITILPSIATTPPPAAQPQPEQPQPAFGQPIQPNINGTPASIAAHLMKDLYIGLVPWGKFEMSKFLSDCTQLENWLLGNRDK